MFECKKCGKNDFVSMRGLAAHSTRVHKLSNRDFLLLYRYTEVPVCAVKDCKNEPIIRKSKFCCFCSLHNTQSERAKRGNTIEAKLSKSKSMKEHWKDQENRDRRVSKMSSEPVRQRISQGQLQVSERKSKSMKRHWSNPKNRKRRCEAQKRAQSKPGVQERKSKALRSPAAQKKRFETMKRNCSFKKSKPEDLIYVALCEAYSPSNVKRQVPVNGWFMDFYVKSIDAFVQFNGDYWHGLDRPIEKIRESDSYRDKEIVKTWDRDCKRKAFFQERNWKLIILTYDDVDMKNKSVSLQKLPLGHL